MVYVAACGEYIPVSGVSVYAWHCWDDEPMYAGGFLTKDLYSKPIGMASFLVNEIFTFH